MSTHTTVPVPLPTVESGQVYAPASLALEIENFQATSEGYLRAVRGPVPLIPSYGSGYPAEYGAMHGVYHAVLDGGMRDVLLIRTADKLCVQRGYFRDLETLKTGLSNDGDPYMPDQFCTVAGKVIWTNGVDSALVYDGYKVLPLGYSRKPSAPTGYGPAAVNAGTNPEENPTVYRNKAGYSHPGRIGTPGDLLAGQDGSLRAGAWYGYIQYEDAFGNLSPLSPPSGPITLRAEATARVANKDFIFWNADRPLGPYSVVLDDLTRQFFWTWSPGPKGTVATRLYRTRDVQSFPTEPLLLARIPDRETSVYPDNHADSELGDPAVDPVEVPVFRLLAPFNGRLAIANTAGQPGVVMLSEPGFPGTFLRQNILYPDPNGDEITALASFMGKLFAFTSTTIYEVRVGPEGLTAAPVTGTVGCVAPGSVQVIENAMLWLGIDGFYGMMADGTIQPISESIRPTISKLNRARLRLATSAYSFDTGEYLCAVPRAGSLWPDLVLAYDGTGWRRRDYGLTFNAMTRTRDDRRMVIAAGEDANIGHNVFVFDREARSYTPPSKTFKFRSAWLRIDPTGRNRFNVKSIYVAFIESCNVKCRWRIYRNGRRDRAVVESVDASALTMQAPDMTDNIGGLTFGEGKVRVPRLFWRRFDVKLTGVDSFAFDLEADESDGAFPMLAGFAFDGVEVDSRGAQVPRG